MAATIVLRRRLRQFVHPRPPYRTPAVVEFFDENNNSQGYAPSSDPLGVFFGVGGIDLGDTWYVSWKSPTVEIEIFAGGSWRATGLPGSYAFEWRRHDFSLGIILYGRFDFVIS